MSTTNINDKDKVNKKIHENNVSVYAYDLAIVEDLRARFTKPDSSTPHVTGSKVNDTVQIGSANNMFSILGSVNDDQVIMPFVSLERTDWQLNLDRQPYQTFIGEKMTTVYDEEGNIIDEIRGQVIPISINYRMSVWTKDRITNDALIRELLFYYHLRPSLMVYVGHGLDIAHKFNIYFNADIEDNSDIANQLNNGTYFRQDLTFYTDDAYLWRARHEQVVEISPQLYFNYGKTKDE